ncbi:MAG TPA: PQQ-binding-like beta-propeller repeat protein [Rhizomicrobium sp.]|jgi:outer membrane protein assembly factor BamB
MKKSSRLPAALAFIGALSLSQPAGAESTAYQIDATHSGSATVPGGFSGPLIQRWRRDLGGNVSYPVTAGGLVFVTVAGQAGASVYALSLQTGATVWHQAIVGKSTQANLAYDNDHVFVTTGLGFVEAFAADTGALQWKFALAQTALTPPVASGGMLYVDQQGSGSLLSALDEATGSTHWATTGPTGPSIPALGGGGIYVVYPCTYFKYATTGSLQWYLSPGCSGDDGTGFPIYANHIVYMENAPGAEVIAKAAGGQLVSSSTVPLNMALWQNPSGKAVGFLVANGALRSVDPVKRQFGWRFAGDSHLNGLPIVLNDTVVIGSSLGTLYLVDANTGLQRSSVSVGAPVGVAHSEGGLTGFGASSSTLLVPAEKALIAYKSKS